MSAAPRDFLSAAEASALLGVRRQTLYAYVSRGLVRSVGDGRSRERLYAREDLERLQQRAQARSGPEAVAASALNLGHPLVPTRITEITPQGPRYRGHLAVDLARRGVAFEQVAELLWTGLWHEEPFTWPAPPPHRPLQALLKNMGAGEARDQLAEAFALVVLQLGLGRGPAQERLIHGRPVDAARELILTLAGCFGFLSKAGRYRPVAPGLSVAQAVLQALGARPAASDAALLDAMLVLLADHELSPGTFAARIAASGGSPVHACLAAGLASSAGTEVARRYGRVEAFLDEAGQGAAMQRQLQRLVSAGQATPGFGHPLYPAGDPRACWLVEQLRARRTLPEPARAALALIDHAQRRHGLAPRHELAVIAACRALRFPPGTAGALFLLSRQAGWVAHVLEQRLSGTLIRPRARFVEAGAAG
ncbi:citrate synthase [Ramlibacter sp. MAHUQ-53]|uniref:citrate synthase n=1 Tax=unclassified Ramlibacter TaxID=2617605 RepID=UPI0036415FD6